MAQRSSRRDGDRVVTMSDEGRPDDYPTVECSNCGAIIVLVLRGSLMHGQQLAVTCDTCGRSIWIGVRATPRNEEWPDV